MPLIISPPLRVLGPNFPGALGYPETVKLGELGINVVIIPQMKISSIKKENCWKFLIFLQKKGTR